MAWLARANAARGASNDNKSLKVRFTEPPPDIPICGLLEHKPSVKSRRNVLEVQSKRFEIGKEASLGPEQDACGVRSTPAGARKLTLSAKLPCFEPSDNVALVGDDLSLPDEDYAHQTHGDDAGPDHEAPLCFTRWPIKIAPKPRHSMNLLVLATAPLHSDHAD